MPSLPNLDGTRALQEILRRHALRRLPCPDNACHRLSGRLILKRGQSRWFWGCTRWPACKQSLSADQITGDPILPVLPETLPASRVRIERVVAHRPPEPPTVQTRVSFTETDSDEFFLDTQHLLAARESPLRPRVPRKRRKPVETDRSAVTDYVAPVKRRIVLEE